MKRGFTLIELMVASILLAMIVSILTMVFNQTAISWRTGVASVVNMNDTRSALGTVNDIRDDILPGLGDKKASGGKSDSRTIQYRTVSLWDTTQRNKLRTTRAFNDSGSLNWGKAQQFTIAEAQKASSMNVVGEGQAANDKLGFSVGVRSLGPDGQPDTPDDISTWPEEID